MEGENQKKSFFKPHIGSLLARVMFIFYFCLSNCAFVVKQAHEVAIYTLKIMTIGIINAMHKEHEQLVALLHDVHETPCGHLRFVEGRFGALHLVLAESGIGKVNAAVGAVELLRRYAPDALVNTGVAGGLDAQVGVMHVVAGQRVAYHDVDCGPEAEHGQVQGLPLYFEADAQLLQAALRDRILSLPDETIVYPGHGPETRVIDEKFSNPYL